MGRSRPAVHPVPEASLPILEAAPRGVRMNDRQGSVGTAAALFLRLCQFVFAAISLCVMVATSDFPPVTAFRHLVAAIALQSLWSLSLALAVLYSVLVGLSFRNSVLWFAVGDWITSILTFSAACASAGATVFIGNDLDKCNVNHCTRFMSATSMAFLSWFAVSPSYVLNLWSVASRY